MNQENHELLQINQSFFKSLDQILINFNQLQHQTQSSPNQSNQISTKLHDELLPTIKHQLTSISILIKPSDLIKPNQSKSKSPFNEFLTLFHQFQSKIQSIFDLLQLQNPSTSTDSNFIQIGQTKLKEIHNLFHDLLQISIQITISYQTYLTSIEDLNQIEFNRKIILQNTSEAWHIIDRILKCFNQSDLEFLQERVKGSVEVIEDALEEVRTILMRTDTNGLEDQLTSLDLDSNSIPIPPKSSSSSSSSSPSPSPSPSLSMFLESTNDQVKLTEVERSRLNLSIPIIRLCRILSLRLVNPSPSNLNLLNSIKLEELEKMVNLIERFSSHIDELISELDSSPHSKSSITKVLNRLSLDCDGLILSLKNGNGDEDRLDLKEIKWFDIWTDQMKNASNSLLQEFD